MHISKSVCLILAAIVIVTTFALPVLSSQTDRQAREEFNTLTGQLNHRQLTPAEKTRYEELRKLVIPPQPREVNPLDNQGGPDAFGYFYMDNVAPDTATYNWIELRGDVNATFLPASAFSSTDDGMTIATYPIGFNFPFYTGAYNSFRIGTNGDIQFLTDYPYEYTQCLPRASSGPAILCLATDLHLMRGGIPSGDNVVGYRDFGTYIVIEWDSIGFFSTGICPNGSLKFELILFNSGRIKMQYNQQIVPAGCYNSYPPNIGIQESGTGTYLTYACGAAGIFPEEGRAIWYFQAEGVPNPVTNLQGQAAGSDVTLTWIDPTTDTNGNPIAIENVQVWLGPVGSGELLGTVSPGVQTYTHVGASNGFHTYNVRAFNDPYYGNPASVTVLVGDFPWHPTDYDWVDISQNGTLLPLGLDEYSGALDIGFEFTFFDQPFTQLWVASHGFVTLNDVGFNFPPYINGPIPDPLDPNNTIYCFWDDNSSSTTGAIYYYQDAVEGRFIISWDGVGHFGSGEQYWFQLILNDDGSIVMNYQTIPINTSVSIGVEDGTGSNGLQACFDGQGDFLPTDGTALIFYEQSGVTAPVSGQVAFDGGSGNITQVLVRASGPGQPTTNPDASGNYTLDSVATGNRRILASHTGYVTDTLLITLDSTGYTGANLTIRRVDPPQPTGLTGSVNNGTGVVTLNWDNSTDPLVDFYRVYRKLASDPNWVLDDTRITSDDTDTLTVAGIYQYAVTAVDDDVVPPEVESVRSVPVTVLYGNLPPVGLSANGNYDDRIHLNWLAPGVHQSYQLFYDDSSAEAFYVVQFPNGDNDYFAVRFTPPSADTAAYPMPISTVNLYEQATDLLPNVMVCPDNGGVPDMTAPIVSWQEVGADASPGWLTVATDGTALLDDDSDFWVVWQFPPGINGPGTGSDANAPDSRSYWTGAWAWPEWQQWTAHDWMARVWVGGEPGWGLVMSVGSPSGYSIERIPMGQTAPTAEMPERAKGPARARSEAKGAGRAVAQHPFPVALEDRFDRPYSLAPVLEYQPRDRGSSLDDILYYRIFRNNVFLANDTTPPYDDVVGSNNENVPYTYYVRAHYDNNQDSDSSNHATGRANMAPGAPSNLAGDPIGASQMRLTWLDPTLNSDGTPCVDLTTLVIYRDGTQIGTVNAGVQQYTDTPPQPDLFYTWTVRGRDEVPNEGPGVSFTGAVTSPWQTCDYEWVDISTDGTDAGITGDDQNVGPFPLGFDFEFYGITYTSIRICSNGFLSFTSTSTVWTNTTIPSSAEPNAALYPFWDDLYPPSGGYQIKYRADSNPQRFIVSYINIAHIQNSSARYTFQVILDPQGGITFNYQSISTNAPGNTSCTVGVENASGTDALQLYYNSAGAFIPTDQTAVCFWGGPTGRIEGVVRAFSNNQPIEGIRVETMQVPVFTFTDVTGFYSLRLDSGLYSVRFSGPGYCDTTFTNILVEDGQTTIRNATLRSPQAQFSVTSISMATWAGHNVSYPFQITNPGGQCALDFSISDTSNWLSADPVSGSVPPNGTVTVNALANVQGLNPGTDYQSALVITHDALGSPMTIPVTLSISLTAEEDPASLPTVYALHANYPNPFNATTSLRFDLPQAGRVKLVVFNVMGQAVVTAADGMYPAGRHSLSFDATDLPSGMYLLKLEAGSYQALQKMLLLK